MKQTAVEWLYNYLFPKQLDGFSDEEWNKIDEAFEQAKAMEKEQIAEAWDDGFEEMPYKNGEDYYNKTFKSE